MPVPPEDAQPARLHRAARVEDVVNAVIQKRMRRRGWDVTIIAYTGYGAPTWARVMGRVLLRRPDPEKSGGRRGARKAEEQRADKVRGWRSFATVPVRDVTVIVEAGGREHRVCTDRSGFIDCVLDGEYAPGWATVTLRVEGAEPVTAPVRVVGPDVTFGILSDVDDTVMVTTLPRPLLAAWNTFVLDEHARAAVPGMAVLFERLATAHPSAPVVYLSTGAFNVAPALNRFLSRHLYPAGPLLLTDWGPTANSWFRSGQEHKRGTLRRLAREFPQVRWLLVGDDGQHDEKIYADFAAAHPDNVAAVAIRHLSPTESVLARGLPVPPGGPKSSGRAGTWLGAPDGAGLWRLMHDSGLL